MGKDAAVVAELLRAFSRRDGDAVAAMVTDDFAFEPLSTEAAARGVYRGGEGVRTYLRDVGETWRQFDLTVAPGASSTDAWHRPGVHRRSGARGHRGPGRSRSPP